MKQTLENAVYNRKQTEKVISMFWNHLNNSIDNLGAFGRFSHLSSSIAMILLHQLFYWYEMIFLIINLEMISSPFSAAIILSLF